MAQYYKTERELLINDSEGNRIGVPAGSYVLTEATGLLSFCSEAELEANIARIDAEIVERNARIEAERLAQEGTSIIEETPPGGEEIPQV